MAHAPPSRAPPASHGRLWLLGALLPREGRNRLRLLGPRTRNPQFVKLWVVGCFCHGFVFLFAHCALRALLLLRGRNAQREKSQNSSKKSTGHASSVLPQKLVSLDAPLGCPEAPSSSRFARFRSLLQFCVRCGEVGDGLGLLASTAGGLGRSGSFLATPETNCLSLPPMSAIRDCCGPLALVSSSLAT